MGVFRLVTASVGRLGRSRRATLAEFAIVAAAVAVGVIDVAIAITHGHLGLVFSVP